MHLGAVWKCLVGIDPQFFRRAPRSLVAKLSAAIGRQKAHAPAPRENFRGENQLLKTDAIPGEAWAKQEFSGAPFNDLERRQTEMGG